MVSCSDGHQSRRTSACMHAAMDISRHAFIRYLWGVWGRWQHLCTFKLPDGSTWQNVNTQRYVSLLYEACTVSSLKGSVSTFKRLQIHSYLFNISMHGAIMQYACMHICSSFNALRIPSMCVCLHDCFLALLPLKAILNHFCSSTVSTAASLHSSNFH